MKSLIQNENQFSGSVYIGDHVNDLHYLRGSIYMGDGGVTNYSKFDSNGKLSVTGSGRVYNTVFLPARALHAGVDAPSSEIYNDTFYYVYQESSSEHLYFSFILPNDYSEGTTVAFSVYCLYHSANPITGDVNWRITCNWNNVAASFGSILYLDSVISIDATDRYMVSITDEFIGTGKKMGSVISGKITREGQEDSLLDSISLYGIGLNYLVDGFGSTNRLTK